MTTATSGLSPKTRGAFLPDMWEKTVKHQSQSPLFHHSRYIIPSPLPEPSKKKDDKNAEKDGRKENLFQNCIDLVWPVAWKYSNGMSNPLLFEMGESLENIWAWNPNDSSTLVKFKFIQCVNGAHIKKTVGQSRWLTNHRSLPTPRSLREPSHVPLPRRETRMLHSEWLILVRAYH